MIIEGKPGPVTLQDGAMAAVRLGKDGALAAQDAHGRYQEAVYRGNVFTACNVAAQALSVALTTTYTGLVIANPIGSGKNLVILSANFIQSAAPSSFAALFLIAGGSSTGILTHTTPLAAPGIQKALVGSGAGIANVSSVATADSAATTVNPYYAVALSPANATGTLPVAAQPAFPDLGGIMMVAPGGWIAIGALTVATGFGSFIWEEILI